jgi:hypothetical protein
MKEGGYVVCPTDAIVHVTISEPGCNSVVTWKSKLQCDGRVLTPGLVATVTVIELVTVFKGTTRSSGNAAAYGGTCNALVRFRV